MRIQGQLGVKVTNDDARGGDRKGAHQPQSAPSQKPLLVRSSRTDPPPAFMLPSRGRDGLAQRSASNE